VKNFLPDINKVEIDELFKRFDGEEGGNYDGKIEKDEFLMTLSVNA